MPPLRPRRSGTVRFLLVLVLIATLSAAAWTARSLGHILHHEDPVERADAIVVLGGSWMTRVAEGGDLYLQGYAPLVVVSRELPDHGEEALRARGVAVQGITDLQVQTLVNMGVPRDAIFVLEPQEATAAESARIARLAAERRWRVVIVVTDKLHTARARLAMQRHLAPIGARVVMRPSRYDPADVDHWWRRRTDLRFSLFETQKMLAYWLGIAD